MTTPIGGGDPLFALASMLVERDSLRIAIEDQNLRAAREEQRRALEREVELMHEAADHVRVGALVSGGITVVGAGTSAYLRGLTPTDRVAAKEIKAMICGADGFAERAKSAGALFGEAARADGEADAKQAAARGSDAAARAEEALSHRERVERVLERSLDTLDQTLEADSQGNLAIIANV